MVVETRLAGVLSEFAHTLTTEFAIQAILDRLVEAIVDILEIDAAGVTLISPTYVPRYVAASDESALRFERVQTDLLEGPCLAAHLTDGPISIPDLAEDDRFPRFAQIARSEGLVAVFTFPLRNRGRGLGALDLYRKTAGLLTEPEMAAAQTLADVASAYLFNAQSRVDLAAASATEREALERLRVIDRVKTEFLTTVIHELRTPLSIINGFTDLLHDGAAGELSDDQVAMVDAIRRNSERITTLADDLLTLAHHEHGPDRHDHLAVDLKEVVLAVESTLQALIDSRGVRVTFEVPPVPVVFHGDADGLERMVRNLVANAVMFTEDDGWVRCSLCVERGHALLEVADNGIGIPEAEQGDLFTRFFRSSLVRQHETPGSGLGLNIVETVVHNHDGTVSVESAQDRGTTVVVDLPLAHHGWQADKSPP
ncbi:HAMP domain-containing sensor histidine kinase [Nocardioides sp.]|uniref:GAF domain-containing sensor histidine kinase n=1 Tax=Nocardioides sp. TaxID=35761 RepID=UPI00271D61C4|nr:HAMP domain-containing sensor histidine kinase [Nocardioides sp.]MDO9457509.1 HAMP domain-containing sensor histidine kinase [Nocardioides sp.]